MNSSRATFLVGSVSTFALAGCGGAASSLRPSAQNGVLSPASIGVRYVRANPLRPIATFDEALRAVYPPHSSIYYYGAFFVQDGPNYATFPQSSTLSRDATGLHVYNDVAGMTTTFSRFATVVLVADAGEAIVAPNQPLNPYLQLQIRAGDAHLVTITSTAQSTSRQASYVQMLPGEWDGGGGGSGTIPPNGNHITSSHVECTTGGENIGISYTVPNEYSENVTVTQCVDNGTTNECFTFTDQVPGSTHNVSVWIAGSGAPNISMGVVSSSGTREGIGWSNLGGC